MWFGIDLSMENDNMVKFNLNDFNFPKISRESKMFSLVTKHPFYVYGLRRNFDSMVLIEYNDAYVLEESEMYVKTSQLKSWFGTNGIDAEIDNQQAIYQNGRITIGIRRDLRDHVVFCACLIQTIIYAYEGRLTLTNVKIPGIPSFKLTTTT